MGSAEIKQDQEVSIYKELQGGFELEAVINLGAEEYTD